jgi:hypothetical protein
LVLHAPFHCSCFVIVAFLYPHQPYLAPLVPNYPFAQVLLSSRTLLPRLPSLPPSTGKASLHRPCRFPAIALFHPCRPSPPAIVPCIRAPHRLPNDDKKGRVLSADVESRVHAHAHGLGWAEPGQKEELGQKERKRSGPSRWNSFSIFFFSKILNSTKVCLFHCELFRAPKMIKFLCSLSVLCTI